MAQACARVPKMAKCYFWVTTSPGSATLLQSQHTGQADAGRLATVAHRHTVLLPRRVTVERGQHYGGTQTQQSYI